MTLIKNAILYSHSISCLISVVKPLITIEEAAATVLRHITPATKELIPLEEASGRVLRESITADRAIPPFDRVMMDGIAIDSSEFHGIGTEFKIEGIQAAGSPALKKSTPQGCLEVMTGAILPEGCDCVIPVEEISITEKSVILSPDTITDSGKFIHRTGSDSQQGSVLLEDKIRLGAAELAIAASVGKVQFEVSKLPQITILTSGDEVIPPSQDPKAFEIRSSHPSFLKQIIEANQLGVCQHIHLPDDRATTSTAILSALASSDFIILTGGISKGKFDFIAPELTKLIGEPLFHGVKQRPGKPFGFWHDQASSTSVFALPGNPLSVCATASRYLIPALIKHQSLPVSNYLIPLSHDFHWKAPIPGLAPSIILDDHTADVQQMQNSGDYLCLARCSGFIEFSQPQSKYAKHTQLAFYPFKLR